MNSHEREQIIALRAAGQSYARIADALNLSVHSVKSFCRRNALSSGASSSIKHIKTEAPLGATACEQCGCPVQQTPGRKRKRFCSDACRTAWWNAHRTQVRWKTIKGQERHLFFEWTSSSFTSRVARWYVEAATEAN